MRWGYGQLWTFLLAGGVLLLAAAGLVAGYFQRRRLLRKLGTEAALARTLRARAPGLRTIKGVLYLLALAGLLAALLRPQHGGREQLVRQFGLDLVIAVDFSKSMLAEDVSPSRIQRVRQEIARLLEVLEGNRVGAVAFAGDAIAFPVLTDLRLVNTFFRNFDPATMKPPGTAIGRALRKSQILLEDVDRAANKNPQAPAKPKDDRARIIVLFTDGEDHEGDPVAAARRAEEELHARVFVVQVGELGGTTIPVRDPVTGEVQLHHTRSGEVATTEITPQVEEKLQQIASPRRADEPDSADRYYLRLAGRGAAAEAILAEIRKLRRTELEAAKVTLYDELYWVPLIPAAVLLAVEALLPGGWERPRRRRPQRVPAGDRQPAPARDGGKS